MRTGLRERQTSGKNDRVKQCTKIPVNVKSKDKLIITKSKAERPVCEPTTVVLGALDAATSQIKITCHRGGGGIAGVVSGRVTPFLACS